MDRIVAALLATAMCLLPLAAFAASLEDIKAVGAFACLQSKAPEENWVENNEGRSKQSCGFRFENGGKAYKVHYLMERRVRTLALRSGVRTLVDEDHYLFFSVFDFERFAHPDAGDIFEEYVGIDSRFGIDVAYGVENEVAASDKKRMRKQFFEVGAFAGGDATGAEFRTDWQQAFGNAVKAALAFKPSELAQAN